MIRPAVTAIAGLLALTALAARSSDDRVGRAFAADQAVAERSFHCAAGLAVGTGDLARYSAGSRRRPVVPRRLLPRDSRAVEGGRAHRNGDAQTPAHLMLGSRRLGPNPSLREPARNGWRTGSAGNWCPYANFVRSSPVVSVEIARRFDRPTARR